MRWISNKFAIGGMRRRPVASGVVCLLLWLLIRPATAAPVIDFTLPDRQQTPVSLSDLKGQVVWLDFWASWCTPCRQAFPWMNQMQRKYGDQGFVVVAVNVDVDVAHADRFLSQVPAEFKILFDTQGEVSQAYQLPGMPSSFLIDRNGDLAERHVGFNLKNIDGYEKTIQQLLATSVAAEQ